MPCGRIHRLGQSEIISVSSGKILMHEDRSLDTLAHPAIDTEMVAPSGEWAVADYAMDELLAPAIRALARDTLTHLLSVFRPTPRHWDTLRVTVRSVPLPKGRALIATVLQTGQTVPTTLVFAPDDVLLFYQDSRTHGSRRGPLDASPRGKELQAIIAAARPQRTT